MLSCSVPFLRVTADGILTKTEKAKVLHHLEACDKPMTTPTNEPVAYVIEGNISLYSKTCLKRPL